MTDLLDGEEPPPGREEITHEQVQDILSAYHRISLTLSVLAQSDANTAAGNGGGADELPDFHAQVAWPWDWNWGHVHDYGWRWVRDYQKDRCRESREEAERLVLGQRYSESYVSGREPQWKSVWEDRFHSDF